MKRILFLTAVFFVATGAVADSLSVDTGTSTYTPLDNVPVVSWYGSALYLNDQGQIGVGVPMSGNLSLFNVYGDYVDNEPWSVLGGEWSDEHQEELDCNDTFTSAINAQTFDQFQQMYGNPTYYACTNSMNMFCDTSGDCYSCDDSGYCCDSAGNCLQEIVDPVIINLDAGPMQLTGLDDPVWFDIRAIGRKDSVGWTASNSNLALLALDRNGNGIIDDGSELFGNRMPLANGKLASDGFAALAQYDSNNDGVIDKKDPIWNSLLLWIDRDHDGISQPDELIPISQSPITAIELAHHWTGRRDEFGNLLRYEGHVHIGDRVQTFYDVFFVIAP